MAKFTLEDTIKTFNYSQAAVIYWYCQGFSNADIASMLGYEISWVIWVMSQVYYKLGLDRADAGGRKLHWTERRRILREKVCPIIKRLTKDNPDFLESFPLIPPNVLEGNILDLRPEIPVPPSEPFIPLPEPPSEPPSLPPDGQIPPPEPPPDFYPVELYNAWLLVLEDDAHDPNGDPLPPPPILIVPERHGPRWGRLLGLGLGVLLGCMAVGYWLGTQRNTPTPTPILASATSEILATETLAETATITLTAPPTETLAPTLTLTPEATLTPIPTDTKSPLGLGVGDELQDERVTLRLTKVEYNQKYDRIGAKVAPISFFFNFTNHSGETIVLQFESTDFQIVDNTGSEADCWFYHISGAGTQVNEPLNNGASREIVARCGLEQLNPAVTTFTLAVHPFSSLPESTWIVPVAR
jgi:hypothetical protein